jgi:hypothetical protein
MMTKTKNYRNTHFSADVVLEAIAVFKQQVPEGEKPPRLYLSVALKEAEWKHETVDEFFADYRQSTRNALYQEDQDRGSFRIQTFPDSTMVTVGAESRAKIEAVLSIFEKHAPFSLLPIEPPPPPTPPTIFIGHGKDPQWRELKDHLHEKHGFKVEAYEIGARAGHAIRDILEEMLSKSSFAFLVMTGEDETSQKKLRARQNVVHEAGLFQGRLGFTRAIVLLERGVEDFSNIQGVEQIRFDRGRIKETFGDAVATVRREFPSGMP